MKTFRKIAILFLLVSLMNFGASNIEGKIAQIRKDFESTNAVKNYVIKEVEDSEQSTDGGVVKYYLQNGIVKKIVVEHFGESWNSLTEYYVKNRKVYFIFDKYSFCADMQQIVVYCFLTDSIDNPFCRSISSRPYCLLCLTSWI